MLLTILHELEQASEPLGGERYAQQAQGLQASVHRDARLEELRPAAQGTSLLSSQD